jgi:3-methylcrotonyl-CoA carboxylase alpha subunit
MKLFEKIVIANRGEIAVRIIRSARKLGIATVCVYSAADKDALYVTLADEAYGLGDGEIKDTYLNIEKIIEIAKISGSDAIHPGYGFLSENPDFAAACEETGICFIGPSSKSIRLMGNKIKARELAVDAGIPVTAGATGNPASLLKKSRNLPFPLLVKAAAGGGGKGMRVVKNQEELVEALISTTREAASYFGDGTVYLEQFIEDPRHIEVQILGDHHGNIIHLFERECSIQRRYQKIVEESPSPTLKPGIRKKICDAAVKIARASGYRNAGTIEFLVDKDLRFYFLEMNTRVQVEHPVTEMVTGVDIVEEQLLIASGNPLRYRQEEIVQKGHAIECRIYAEDPENNFMPSPGEITLYSEPSGKDVRIDTGIAGVSVIRSFYDPMIAKLIVWGDDRSIARQRMIQSLNSYIIQGIRTNISYLNALLQLGAFIENKISTRFCDSHTDEILGNILKAKNARSFEIPLLAYLVFSLTGHGREKAGLWESIGFWRINCEMKVRIDGREYFLELLHRMGNHFHFRYDGKDFKVSLVRNEKGKIEMILNGNYFIVFASTDKRWITQITHEGFTFICERNDILVEQEIFSLAGYSSSATDHKIASPMPGKLVKVNVTAGSVVRKGDILLVVEAMKMENNITAPKDGVIESIHVKQGDMVDPSTELLTFAAES